jgi:hypothetical protein
MPPAKKQQIRRLIEGLVCAALVYIAYWNILGYGKVVADLPRSDIDDVVKMENRYQGIRATLIQMKYRSGPIRFVTNRDLQSKPTTVEDDKNWSLGQYVMVPWILFRNGRAVSGHREPEDPRIVIADFWDGPPSEEPEGLTKIFDSGTGLVLYRRN